MIAFCQQCAHPKTNGSREPKLFWMCASPQVGLCHIQELLLWHGGACVGIKTDKSETILVVMVGINKILSVGNEYVNSMGIHRQAMAGE
jgi:hypothetical protein